MSEPGTDETVHVRDLVLAELELPTEWNVIRAQRTPDKLSCTTVVLKHARITPLAEAPIGHVQHSFTLNVSSPFTAPERAEDDLDGHVSRILTAIDGHPWISWSEAEKVGGPAAGAFGWDISLTAISSLEPKE